MDKKPKYVCDVCGHEISYPADICDNCGFENNPDNKFMHAYPIGNDMSLDEAREAYKRGEKIH